MNRKLAATALAVAAATGVGVATAVPATAAAPSTPTVTVAAAPTGPRCVFTTVTGPWLHAIGWGNLIGPLDWAASRSGGSRCW